MPGELSGVVCLGWVQFPEQSLGFCGFLGRGFGAGKSRMRVRTLHPSVDKDRACPSSAVSKGDAVHSHAWVLPVHFLEDHGMNSHAGLE